MLHVLTKKGKGFPKAIEEPEKWHGAGPFEKKTGKTISNGNPSPPKYQDVFGSCLAELAKRDSDIVGITAAMPSGTGLNILEEAIPERFFDVGIAEEHAVVMAAGMATQGMKPVCAIYSTFLQRAYDPIIHDVCLQELPVTFCLDRAGLSPNDGPTHHGLFDLSFLRCIPNAIVMSPSNENELQNMLITSVESKTFIHSLPKRNNQGATIQISIKDSNRKSRVSFEGQLFAIWALWQFRSNCY